MSLILAVSSEFTLGHLLIAGEISAEFRLSVKTKKLANDAKRASKTLWLPITERAVCEIPFEPLIDDTGHIRKVVL